MYKLNYIRFFNSLDMVLYFLSITTPPKKHMIPVNIIFNDVTNIRFDIELIREIIQSKDFYEKFIQKNNL